MARTDPPSPGVAASEPGRAGFALSLRVGLVQRGGRRMNGPGLLVQRVGFFAAKLFLRNYCVYIHMYVLHICTVYTVEMDHDGNRTDWETGWFRGPDTHLRTQLTCALSSLQTSTEKHRISCTHLHPREWGLWPSALHSSTNKQRISYTHPSVSRFLCSFD